MLMIAHLVFRSDRSLCLWMIATLLVLTSTHTLPAAELNVPASTSYSLPDPDGLNISSRGVSNWTGGEKKVVWFGNIKTIGKLTAAVRLALPEGRASKLQLTVAEKSHLATITGQGMKQELTVKFGEFEIEKPGYYGFELSSLNAPESQTGHIHSLVLDGVALEGAHFNLDPRRNAASVHLAYPVPKETQVKWFYSEVTAVEDPVTTFYMACGFHRGYFGMQVNSATERRIIFSVWDAGSGSNADDRSSVDKEDYVSLVSKGNGVHTSVFGGEGTGGHSHLKFLWKTGEVQKFLVTAEPIDSKATVYSGYYFHPEQQSWMLISSMRAPKDGGYLKGLHGFSENFSGTTGFLRRKALYGNQWIQTAQGEWKELTVATFSHDATGKSNRLDRFMGVEGQQFFLSHGGFVPGYTQFGQKFERPATGRQPAIQLP